MTACGEKPGNSIMLKKPNKVMLTFANEWEIYLVEVDTMEVPDRSEVATILQQRDER